MEFYAAISNSVGHNSAPPVEENTTLWYVSLSGISSNSGHSPGAAITFDALLGKDILAGDTILFRRGDNFHFGDFAPGVSVIIDAYDSGADPIITGSQDISGLTWTNEGSGFYSASIADDVLWVFINGVAARLGETAWIPITSSTTQSLRGGATATLNPFNSVQSLVGATYRELEFEWRMSFPKTITAYNSTTGVMTLSSALVGAGVGMSFMLSGQKQFCTLEGDWYYDSAANKLWVKTAVNPTVQNIQACFKNQAFNFDGVASVAIKNLELQNYYRAGATLKGTDATIDNVAIHDIHLDGLLIYDGSSVNITDTCEIYNCGLNGITTGAIHNSTIEAHIHDIGEDLNMAWPINTGFLKSGGCGIASSPDPVASVKLSTNVTYSGIISDVGYCGLLMLGSNWLVENFSVSKFCSRFSDGGGLYSFFREDLAPTEGTFNNVFRNGLVFSGYASGNDGGVVGGSAHHLVNGVYLDAGSHNTEIRDVFIDDIPFAGVLCNIYTEQTKIYDTKIYNCAVASVLFAENTSVPAGFVFANNYKNILSNCELTAKAGKYCVITVSNVGSSYNPFSSGGSSDNNSFVNPYKTLVSGDASFGYQVGSTIVGPYTARTFASWKSTFSVDASSIEKAFYLNNLAPSAASAFPEIVWVRNPTDSPVVHDLTDGYYTDAESNNITDITIPAFGAGSAFLKASYYSLMDDFLNANATNMSGKAPLIGPNCIVASGTHDVNNGNARTTVGGVYSWNTGVSNNYAYELSITVSAAVSVLHVDLRLNDDAGSANNRLLLDWNGTNIRLREFFASAVATQTWTTAFTQTNTTYRIRIEVRGSNIKVYVAVAGVYTKHFDVTTSLTTGARVGVGGATTAVVPFVVQYPIT